MKRPLLLCILVTVGLLAVQLQHLVTWSSQSIAASGLFPDDAYFYSAIARNAHLGFLTLDGEMPTNGVHPLWMGLQILLVTVLPWVDSARLLGISSWSFYLGVALLSILGLVRFGGGSETGRSWLFALVTGTSLLVGAVLGNVEFQGDVVQGLETSMCLFLVLGLLLLLDQFERRTGGAANEDSRVCMDVGVLGLFSALCFLARTDLFAFPVVVLVFVFRRRGLRAAVIFSATAAALVLPYLAHNFLTFGHIVPISGRAKLFYTHATYPDLRSYLASGEWHGFVEAFSGLSPHLPESIPIRLTLAIVLFGGAQFLVWRRSFRPAIRLAGVALLLHTIYMYGFFRSIPEYASYYFAPEVLWSSLVFASTVYELGRSGRRAVPILAATAALVLLGANWMARDLSPTPYWTQRLRLAEDIATVVPEGVKVAAFWPGAFTQFSGEAITPLDGIIGSSEYFDDYVKAGREMDLVAGRSPALLAIYLTFFPDRLLAIRPRPETHWTSLGERRLQDLRLGWTVRTVASRTIEDWGSGWYLLELTRDESRPGAVSEDLILEPPGESASVNELTTRLIEQNRRLLSEVDELVSLVDRLEKRTDKPTFRPLIEAERETIQINQTRNLARRRLLEIGRLRSQLDADLSAVNEKRLRAVLLRHQLETSTDWAVFALIQASWKVLDLEFLDYEKKQEFHRQYQAKLRGGRTKIRAHSRSLEDEATLELQLRDEFSIREIEYAEKVQRAYQEILDDLASDVRDLLDALRDHRSTDPPGVDATRAELASIYVSETPRSPLLERTLFCAHLLMYDLTAAESVGRADEPFGFCVPRSWGFELGCCWNGAAWFPNKADAADHARD